MGGGGARRRPDGDAGDRRGGRHRTPGRARRSPRTPGTATCRACCPDRSHRPRGGRPSPYRPVAARRLRRAAVPWQGVLYDHPVVQADWGLDNLNAYQVTGDRFFLDRAIAQARRNLDRKVESRGAWWYSYPFDLPRCTGLVLQAPWYSAMAQGSCSVCSSGCTR
ncbi:hypothetical protein V2I01_27810 [Micromonospora sp. BRA006-A]|nr:hypothetical protein [Micromonospora sp. BRA006-A]